MSRSRAQSKDKWEVGSLVIASVWSDSQWLQCQSLVRYAGPTLSEKSQSESIAPPPFSYGLELLERHSRRGDCDGSRNGFRYFHCAPNAGLFVEPSRIKRAMNATDFAGADEVVQKVKSKQGRPRSAESAEERRSRHSRGPSLLLSSVNPALDSEDECRVDLEEDRHPAPKKRGRRESKTRLRKRRSLVASQVPPPPPSRPPPSLASSASSSALPSGSGRKGRSRAWTSSSPAEMEARAKQKQRSAATPKWDPKTYSFASETSSDEPFGYRVSRRSSYNAGEYKSDIRAQLRSQSAVRQREKDEPSSGSLSDHPPSKTVGSLAKKRASLLGRRKSKSSKPEAKPPTDLSSPPLKRRKSSKKRVGFASKTARRLSSAGESSPGPALILTQSESSNLIRGADDTWFEADLFDTDASSLTNEDMESVLGMVVMNTPLADSDSDDSDKVDDRYTSPFSIPGTLLTDSDADVSSFVEPLSTSLFSQSLGELSTVMDSERVVKSSDSPTKRGALSSLRRDSKSRGRKSGPPTSDSITGAVPKKRGSVSKKRKSITSSKRRNSHAESQDEPALSSLKSARSKKSGTPKASQTPRLRTNSRKKSVSKGEPSTAPAKRTAKRKGSVSKGTGKSGSTSKSSSTEARMVGATKAIQPPTKISTPRKKPLKKRRSLLKSTVDSSGPSSSSLSSVFSTDSGKKQLKASEKERSRIAAESGSAAHRTAVTLSASEGSTPASGKSSSSKTRPTAKSVSAISSLESKMKDDNDDDDDCDGEKYEFSMEHTTVPISKAFPMDARLSSSLSHIAPDAPDSAKTHKSSASAASEPTHVRRLSKLSALSGGSSISDDSLLSDGAATHHRSNTFDDIRANLFLMNRESNDIAETWDMVTTAGPSTPGIHDLLKDETDTHSTGFFFSHAFESALDQES